MSYPIICKLIFGLIKLTAMISIGVLIGTAVEQLKLERRLSFLLIPLSKWTGLSTVGATTFIIAFASPRAANIMLASSCDEGIISKRNMILSALANSVAAVFVHLRITAFILIPLLGTVGLAYIGVQILGALTTTFLALFLLKKTGIKDNNRSTIEEVKIKSRNKSFFEIVINRNKKILFRVLIITVPLYTVIYFLNYYGIFKSLSKFLPLGLKSILSPDAILIIGVHFSGIMPAASAASLAFDAGSLNSAQIFITLLIGYIITTPIRAVRHTLPSALGIFPGRTGLYIVAISQSIRIVVAIIVILFTVKVIGL